MDCCFELCVYLHMLRQFINVSQNALYKWILVLVYTVYQQEDAKTDDIGLQGNGKYSVKNKGQRLIYAFLCLFCTLGPADTTLFNLYMDK